jgi:hypothetical protein
MGRLVEAGLLDPRTTRPRQNGQDLVGISHIDQYRSPRRG